MTGPIIFSIHCEIASWPMLLDATLRIAKAVLVLFVWRKLKGVWGRGYGDCRAASRSEGVSGGWRFTVAAKCALSSSVVK